MGMVKVSCVVGTDRKLACCVSETCFNTVMTSLGGDT